MSALARLLGWIRSNPWITVAIAAGALLVAAWLAWAIYVASDEGVNEGLGVLIAWPAIVASAILIVLPFVGVYLLIRRLSGESTDDEPSPADETETPEPEEAEATEAG